VGSPRSSFSRGAGTPRQASGGLGAVFYQFIRNAAGVLLPQRLETQFTGGGVTITDDPPNNRTIVDLSSVSAAECLIFGANGTLTTANNRWLFPGYAQANPRNSDTIRMIAPRPGTLRNMYVKHNVVGADGTNLNYRVQINGVNAALQVDILDTAASGSDLVNTVAVAAGDEIGVRLAKAAALSVEADRPVVTMEFA
jgi:hypothetical protein